MRARTPTTCPINATRVSRQIHPTPLEESEDTMHDHALHADYDIDDVQVVNPHVSATINPPHPYKEGVHLHVGTHFKRGWYAYYEPVGLNGSVAWKFFRYATTDEGLILNELNFQEGPEADEGYLLIPV